MSSTTAPPDSSNRGFIIVLALIVMVGLGVVALLATQRSDDETTAGGAASEIGEVEVTGDPLAPMPDGLAVADATNDPVAGTVAPTLVGTDFDGSEVRIEADGRPKAVYFVAHWCPHCQEEIPVVQGLIDGGELPEGMDVYAVSTGYDPDAPNNPPEPSEWLAGEGFVSPTIRDDDAGTAMGAYGGRSYPYVVYLDGDNQLVARSSGNIDREAILALWALTASS